MKLLATLFTALVALLHSGFLVLEMFLWESPIALNAFGTTAEFASETAFMAANQGLYNGFIAAGLFWGLLLIRVLQGLNDLKHKNDIQVWLTMFLYI